MGLKAQLEWEHPFHNIGCLCWLAERSFNLNLKPILANLYYAYVLIVSQFFAYF